jgi:hypothetical protein
MMMYSGTISTTPNSPQIPFPLLRDICMDGKPGAREVRGHTSPYNIPDNLTVAKITTGFVALVEIYKLRVQCE